MNNSDLGEWIHLYKIRSVLLKGHFNGNVNSCLHSAILVSKNDARCLLHSVKFCSIKKLCDKIACSRIASSIAVSYELELGFHKTLKIRCEQRGNVTFFLSVI